MSIAQDTYKIEYQNYPSQTSQSVGRAWAMMNQQKWKEYQKSWPNLGHPIPLVSGRTEPNAEMIDYSDGSALITLNDGLVLFLDSACRALASGTNWSGPNGAIFDKASLSPEEVNAVLLGVYQQWPKLFKAKKLEPPPIPLSQQGEELAWGYFAPAILYILMHELGHAALHRGKEFSKERELEADGWAIKALLRVFGKETDQINICLAGALLSIRAYSAVDALIPNAFPAGYPPPAERFDAILNVFKNETQLCPDDISYFCETTIAFALDLRMRATELAYRGQVITSPLKAPQLLSSLVSILIEVHAGRMKGDDAVGIIQSLIVNAPANLLKEAGAFARRVFSPEQHTCRQDGAIGKKHRQIIKLFEGMLPKFDGPAKIFAEEAHR